MKQDKFLRVFNLCTGGPAMRPSLIYTDEYTYLFYADSKGRRGPVTFIGTPREVVEKLRRYQKVLNP